MSERQPLPNFVKDGPPEYMKEYLECPECAELMILVGMGWNPDDKSEVFGEYNCQYDDCPTSVRLQYKNGKIVKAECFRIYQGHQEYYEFTSKVDMILNPKVRQ